MNALPTKKITVDLPSIPRGYDILVGASLIGEAGPLIKDRFGTKRCLIVTDRNVAVHYQQRLEAVLAAAGHTVLPTIILPAGETTKDFATLWVVLEKMFANNIDRSSMIIALGGGVIGDLTGLASSLALRGIDVIQIPTSLMAQVDSSIGGKNGINSAYGKNTVGTFFQPRLVLSDVSMLDSLSSREMLAGYAEILKYGLIRDHEFFEWCQKHGGRLLRGDREAQIFAISRCCENKATLVAADEREEGERALLNFGHTFGHALEVMTGYGPALLHGEAVAIGMVLAFKLSCDLGLCPREHLHILEDHLKEVGLPTSPPRFSYDVERLMELMTQDKKTRFGKLTLVMAKGIGNCFVNTDVNPSPVKALWQTAISSTV